MYHSGTSLVWVTQESTAVIHRTCSRKVWHRTQRKGLEPESKTSTCGAFRGGNLFIAFTQADFSSKRQVQHTQHCRHGDDCSIITTKGRGSRSVFCCGSSGGFSSIRFSCFSSVHLCKRRLLCCFRPISRSDHIFCHWGRKFSCGR